jgi:CheY-like chemotaxis protein
MQPSLILVVDPDPDIRAMYAMGLSVSGWAAEPIADGREALAIAISRRPDVVVTEARVPGLDGIELCRLLKRDPDTRHIPILIVTSDAHEQQIAKAKHAGADEVLVKPCLTDELIATVKGMLTTKALRSLRPAPARVPVSKTARRRRARSRVYQRGQTTAPPQRPPNLFCPTCDRPLAYVSSHIGGVSENYGEQWDEYECPGACGRFQYRQRTRRVRRMT